MTNKSRQRTQIQQHWVNDYGHGRERKRNKEHLAKNNGGSLVAPSATTTTTENEDTIIRRRVRTTVNIYTNTKGRSSCQHTQVHRHVERSRYTLCIPLG